MKGILLILLALATFAPSVQASWSCYISVNGGALHYLSRSASGTHVYIDWSAIKKSWETYSSYSSSLKYPTSFTLNGKYYPCAFNSTYNFGVLQKGQSFTVVVPAPGVEDGTLAVEWKVMTGNDASYVPRVVHYMAYGSAKNGSVTLKVNPWEYFSDTNPYKIKPDTWNYLYFGVRKGNKATEGHTGYFRFPKAGGDLTFSVEPLEFTYNGQEQGPTITATDANGGIVEATNYIVEGDPTATESGAYTLNATAIGGYSGTSGDVNWKINPATATFVLDKNYFDYDGTPKTVHIIATPSDTTFTGAGTFTATAPGTYVVSATATGNYTGGAILSWNIGDSNGKIAARAVPDAKYKVWFNPSNVAERSIDVTPAAVSAP